MADKFVVKEGKQVIFSSDDAALCEGVAKQRTLDLVNRGCDVRNDEFKVAVSKQEQSKN